MNNVIPINYNGDRPTVLGRELHKELEVSTRYNDWFKRMCEYGFTEN
ncbi:MAG: antA/AntB antirepressor family protein, partial [Lachnospiraceae bacterium]|nr:antA/AntB antirepressor family protein [Lachnospiraceae bacterium]